MTTMSSWQRYVSYFGYAKDELQQYTALYTFLFISLLLDFNIRFMATLNWLSHSTLQWVSYNLSDMTSVINLLHLVCLIWSISVCCCSCCLVVALFFQFFLRNAMALDFKWIVCLCKQNVLLFSHVNWIYSCTRIYHSKLSVSRHWHTIKTTGMR